MVQMYENENYSQFFRFFGVKSDCNIDGSVVEFYRCEYVHNLINNPQEGKI